MGEIHLQLFSTLDLVGQSPGSPGEDPGGFAFGGWQAPLITRTTGAQVVTAYEGTDALLLGRRTYDVFAAYWPHQQDLPDAPGIATLFNRVPKHVASRGTPELTWAGSHLLGPDLPAAVREVRDRYERVQVVGSLDLVQTLLRHGLVDRLNLWVHPLVLGAGKKVFAGGAVPAALVLREPPVADERGTVLLQYDVTGRVPATGDMADLDR